MGSEAVWVPAVIAAIGGTVSAYTTKHAADQQDDIAAQGIRTQGRDQQQADQRISQELDAMQGSNPDDERQKSLDDYTATLRSARAQQTGGTGVAEASSRYKADKTTSEAGIQNFGGQVANTLSKIMGANKQRMNESISVGRMNSDVGGIARNAGADDFLTRLRYGAATPNPWGMAAGQTLQGVAQGVSNSYANGGANTNGLTTNPALRNRRAPSPFGGGNQGY